MVLVDKGLAERPFLGALHEASKPIATGASLAFLYSSTNLLLSNAVVIEPAAKTSRQ